MTDPAPDTPDQGEAPSEPPKRFLFLRRKASADAPAAEAATTGSAAQEPAAGAGQDAAADTSTDAAEPERVRPGVIRRRRRKLTATYEQGIFDLGGLAMELHSRGLLAEDVMRRRAAEVGDIRLQLDDLDAQLEEIRQERKDRRQSGRGASVTCPNCGTRSRSTANFCWSCGTPLKPDEPTPADAAADQPTTVIVEEQVTTVIVEEADPQPTATLPRPGQDDA